MCDNLRDVIANLRAIIISFKGALPIVSIQKDYVEAFGEKVPLKSLGCSSLRQFLENNPTEFRLVGDKVTVVEKSQSAHISSLVQRQRKGRTGRHCRPRNRNGPRKLEYIPTSGKQESFRSCRQTNGKIVSSERENLKAHVKTQDSIEKITLRSPQVAKQSTQNSVVPPLFESATNIKSVTKTIINEKCPSPQNIMNEGFEHLEPFKDVEDLPVGKNAQSRLLKKKYKMLENLKTSEESQNLSAEPQPLELYFDLSSTSSPSADLSTPESLPSPSTSISSTGATSPTFIASELSNTRQKAQARIANIKSTLQTNLIQYEINNNNTTNNFSLGLYVSNDTEKNFSETHFTEESRTNSLLSQKTMNILPVKGATCKNKINLNNHLGKSGSGDSPASSPFDISGNNTEYMTILEEMCKSRGFQKPIYKMIVRVPKNEPQHYICKVSIENYLQISSYPLETQDELSAKNIAAKKMVDYLNSDPGFTNNSTVSSKEEEVLPRILEIVSPTYGVWSDKLPILYKERYKADLRKDWLDIIMKTSVFEIDNFDGIRFIVRKKTDNNSISLGLPVEAQTRQLAQPEKATLKELVLPETGYWEVYITNVSNSSEIWCRLIGEDYSDAYDDLMTKLELEPPDRKAVQPTVGTMYGIKVSDIWYRVKLTERVEDRQGMVFYIDVGDKEVVDITELYEPQEVFYTVVPQAIMLSLHELGSFSDDEELTSIITGSLLGNTYIAEVLDVSHEKKDFEHKGKTVRLWDTSTERDINVNQLLLNNIIKNITLPSLPNINQIKEVSVSSVNENGDIHIQTDKKSIHHLNCLIFNKIKTLEGNPMRRKTNDTIGTDIIHITKCKKNDIFCRVKVIEIHNLETVDVSFVDYGFVERIAISDLIHLEKSSILQAIPAQAVKVKLANITNFNADIIKKLREFLFDQNLLMKVLATNRGSAPLVEFFRRTPVGILYSVNEKIVGDPDLKNSDIPERRKSVVVGMEKVLPRDLPPPKLPDLGQYFEIFVTCASSPDLFIVQPLSSRMQLMEMMNELQVICNGPNMSAIAPKDFVVGKLYAVKHPDGNWYRGCAQVVLGSYNYSVYLCDFGDCIMVTNDRLQHLPAKFQKIPYQAIRATLSGIPAEHRDWTPVDSATFHKLVVEKYFVSTVIDIQRDEKNPNYLILELILTDTSGEEDILVHKVLLEKKNEAFTFMRSSSII